MPVRAVYQQDPKKFSEREKTRRIAKQPHVSEDDRERLRLQENRLEALSYGPDKKCVCLNCGWIGDNLSRHVSACPVKAEDSDAYGERWGYNRSTSLTSEEWRKRKSQTLKNSTKFLEAKEKNRYGWRAAATAQREAVSAAKKAGQPIRRGQLRAEGKLRRHGRGLTRRLRRPDITDAQIEKILILDLPISEGARRAGLSQTAFYRRIQRRHGWTADDVKARRSLVTKYIFELRQWLQSQNGSLTVQDVTKRHMAGLRSSKGHFQQFRQFFPHLEAELIAHPEWLRELADLKLARLKANKGRLVLGSAAVALASKIFQRSRARKGCGAPKKSKPEHTIFGEMVNRVLPRFREGFDLLRVVKRKSPSNSQHWPAALEAKRFSDKEISAILASRKAEAAAIRWVCEREGKTLKTGQNDYSLFLTSQRKQTVK